MSCGGRPHTTERAAPRKLTAPHSFQGHDREIRGNSGVVDEDLDLIDVLMWAARTGVAPPNDLVMLLAPNVRPPVLAGTRWRGSSGCTSGRCAGAAAKQSPSAGGQRPLLAGGVVPPPGPRDDPCARKFSTGKCPSRRFGRTCSGCEPRTQQRRAVQPGGHPDDVAGE